MFLPKFKTANIIRVSALVIGIFIFFIFVNTRIFSFKVNAAGLYLNPATGSILTPTFELTVSADTETSANVKSMDAYITFDPTLAQVDKVDKIGLTLASTATYNNSLGTVHIKGDFEQTPATGSVVNFAKIFLSTKPNTKGKPVSFTFEEGTNKSSMLSTTNTQILSKTVGSDLLIDVANVNTSTTPQPTQNSVPSTGDSDTIFYLITIAAGIVLTSFTIRKYAYTKL